MGGFSIWHWIILGGVVFILFGGKFKVSDVMGDVAKGIKAFKKGLAEPDEPEAGTKPVERLTQDAASLDKPQEAKKL